jgi:hypothetical protein
MKIDPNAPISHDKPLFVSDKLMPEDMERLSEYFSSRSGLTIRAHFAAMCLQGMVANPSIIGANARCGWDYVNCTPENVAQAALAQADALIAELNK